MKNNAKSVVIRSKWYKWMGDINFTFKAAIRESGARSLFPHLSSKLGVRDDKAHEKVTQENWVAFLSMR